jgi:hypothetical protein
MNRFLLCFPGDDGRRGLCVAACPTRREAEESLDANPGAVFVQAARHHQVGEFVWLQDGSHADGPGWPGSRS